MTQTRTRIAHSYAPTITRLIWVIFCVLLAYFYVTAMQQFSDSLLIMLDDNVPANDTMYVLSVASIPLSISRSLLIWWSGLVILIGYITSAFIVWKRGDDWVAIGTAIGLLYVGRIAILYEYNGTVADFVPSMLTAIYITILLVFPDGHLKPKWSAINVLWGIIAELPLELLFTSIEFEGAIEFTRTAYPIPLILVLVYRYRNILQQEAKQQAKWLFILIFVLALGQAMYSLPELFRSETLFLTGKIFRGVGEILYYVGATSAPVAIVFAMLRYRLWDVDLFINRTLVYGTVAVLVMTLFFAISAALQVSFGNTSPIFALVISAALSVGFFRPVRNQTQHFIDRYIYRLRFDLNELDRRQLPPTITNPGKLTGQQLGEYQVHGVIGRGGMGEVYEGYGNGKRVAIKTMLAEIARDPDFRIRFEREAEAGRTIQHPNITGVLASGNHNGTPYLVMEFIDGKDLGEMLKGGGLLTIETACRIMAEICSALDAAHSAGYVHRDIKPSNIMLRDDGRAMLMDFGISKANDTHDLTGTDAVGTIQYMAPEQIMSSRDVDHRADIYALGCVLYHLLIGQTPFTGDAAQIMFAQLNQPAPDPRDKDKTVPFNLADAILIALEKEPEDRFSSAGDFASALSS